MVYIFLFVFVFYCCSSENVSAHVVKLCKYYRQINQNEIRVPLAYEKTIINLLEKNNISYTRDSGLKYKNQDNSLNHLSTESPK